MTLLLRYAGHIHSPTTISQPNLAAAVVAVVDLPLPPPSTLPDTPHDIDSPARCSSRPPLSTTILFDCYIVVLSLFRCPPPRAYRLLAPRQCLPPDRTSASLHAAASRRAPLVLWCGHLLSSPAGCRVASCCATTSHLPAPQSLVAPPLSLMATRQRRRDTSTMTYLTSPSKRVLLVQQQHAVKVRDSARTTMQKVVYFLGGRARRRKRNIHPADALVGTGRVGRGLGKGWSLVGVEDSIVPCGGHKASRRCFLHHRRECFSLLWVNSHPMGAPNSQFWRRSRTGK